MNQQPGGGGNGGFPGGGSINPQALQAALGQAQQQQGQGGNAAMMGMGTGMGSMNPALLQQQQQQQQSQPSNNMGGGGGGGGQGGVGGGNDVGSSQQQGNSMIPAGLPPQNAVAMLQALRGNMNNLQGQWSNVASQPDSPAKQQEQTRLATEMKRLKGIHDQLINMLRSQQGQQQQQGARPQQPQGQQQQQQMVRGQQQAPATPTQANAGSPPPQQQQQGPAHQSRPSMQMQDPSAAMQGMPPYGQANAGMAMGQGQGQSQGGQGQGFPGTPGSAGGMGANGMPFGAENPQHQSQLAALQAFAQQQQQRQQQQSQHHGTPQQQHGTPQGMTGTPQMQNQQPPQQQQQGMMPPGPPQQQQQQPPPTPSQAPPLPPGLSNLSQFTAILGSFMTQRGTPFPPNAPMTFVGPAAAAATPNSNETRPIELNALFAAVVGMGGSARLSSTTVPGTSSNVPQALTGWIILANKLGLAVANPDPQGEGRRDQVPTPAQTPERLRNWYRERLAPFEEWWMNRSKQQQQQQQQQQQGGGAAAGTPGPGQSNPPTPMQQQAQPQQQQRPDGMPGPSSQQGYGNQQQMMQGQQQPPQQQQQQQQQPGARPPAQGPAPPLTPAQQQAIQQLAHQLQRAVAEGKLSSEDARNRFMQAQAAIRGQGAPPQQQQGAGSMQGQPSAGPSNEPVQAPTPAASTTSETPDQKGAGKKRPRKSGGQNAAGGGGAAANKGAKMPKMEYGGGEGTPTVDTRPASRQGSMQAPGTPVGGAPPSAGPSAMPQMPPQQQPQAPQLTPKTAMRMLQQGNLNPAQQAAALAAVRAGSQAQAQAQAQQQQQQQQSMRPPSSAGAQGPLPPPPFGAHPAAPDGMNDPGRQAPQPYQQPPPPQQQQQPPQPAPPAPAPEPHPPNKYKVEYLPLRRDISTHGGWSLSLIDQELTPFTRGYGKQPRSVRELGSVDISAIVFSLKSGLEVEVSWALNTLLVLSSGSGVRYDAFHVGLAHCGDLLEELVGVLERSALCVEGEGEKLAGLGQPSFDIEGKSTHADWVAESLEAEEEAKLFRRATSFNKRQSSRSSAEVEDEEAVTPPTYHAALMEEREKSRKADLAMTVLDILRNFASMQQNVDLLARHTRLLELLGKMVERHDDGSSSPSHVFTPTEHLRIRKDVLFLLSCISGPTLRLPTLPVRTVASLFDLLCSFLVDGASIEELAGLIYDYPPAPPPQQPGMPPPMRPAPVPWAARVPHYAEMALDSFARFAQPDPNRRLLAQLVPESTLFHLAQTLVRMLPCSDVDFSLFRTEARLAYTEHIAMCLFNVVFMASSRLKGRLRNGTAGWVGAVWRVVKKTARQGQAAAAADGGQGRQEGGSFTQNPFSALIFRLVETLKLVDEARDLFDQHPSLAFAGQEDSGRGGSPGEGEVAVSTRATAKKKAPLLALEEMDVVQLLATPGMDPVLVGHLSSMIEG